VLHFCGKEKNLLFLFYPIEQLCKELVMVLMSRLGFSAAIEFQNVMSSAGGKKTIMVQVLSGDTSVSSHRGEC